VAAAATANDFPDFLQQHLNVADPVRRARRPPARFRSDLGLDEGNRYHNNRAAPRPEWRLVRREPVGSLNTIANMRRPSGTMRRIKKSEPKGPGKRGKDKYGGYDMSSVQCQVPPECERNTENKDEKKQTRSQRRCTGEREALPVSRSTNDKRNRRSQLGGKGEEEERFRHSA